MTVLADSARSTASQLAMFPAGSPVLALVSGGADSVALLRLLAAGELGTAPERLRVLHVNHGLRGADSDGDEAFVVALCGSLGVPCEIVRYDVAAYAAETGLNLEDAGRTIRYRFAESALDALCEQHTVRSEQGRIAVAHTFDDRLETFLARLVTGAGASGLRSIAPVRGRIARPLINARRADVLAYLGALGQTWREDATNADTSRQRSWVRHQLLPLIEERNPAFDAVAARTLAILAEEDTLLDEMAAAFARDFTRVESGVLVLERGPMGTLSLPMARRTVRGALHAAFPEASRIEFEHVEALVAGLADPLFARDLPCGLQARAEYGTLRISRRGETHEPLVPGLLELPGRLDLGPGGVIESTSVEPQVPVTGGLAEIIDADAVRWPLVVDGPAPGDRMSPLGMSGTKKVSDLLTDAKVPRRMRPVTPVVRDGGVIVWVAGVRLAEQYRVRPDTVRAALLVWRPPGTGTT